MRRGAPFVNMPGMQNYSVVVIFMYFDRIVWAVLAWNCGAVAAPEIRSYMSKSYIHVQGATPCCGFLSRSARPRALPHTKRVEPADSLRPES
jgi:hypothetical protein